MFSRCLACHRPFPSNHVLEHFARARRVAYDPRKGRLWAVCGGCRRWTLAPIEERWEALEELERLVTADPGAGGTGARMLSSTDRVALYRAGDVEVVRVGDANAREEAWWRYGRELVDRRRRWMVWTAAGVALAGGVVAGGVAAGLGIAGTVNLLSAAQNLVQLRMGRRAFGDVSWRGEAPCARCGAVLRTIGFNEEKRLSLVQPGEEGEPYGLRIRCYRCGAASPEAGYRIEGLEAEHTVRRSLARHNARGASERVIEEASALLEGAGSAPELLRRFAGDRRGITGLSRTERVALEIAANDDAERRLLRLELADLEARWREEERLAAIVDGELTPTPSPAGQ